MFAIKYMQHWNGATIAHSIAEVSTTKTIQLGSFAVFTFNAHDSDFCCAGQDAFISIEAGRYVGYECCKQC